MALAGAAVETVAVERMKKRLGMLAEPYEQGPLGTPDDDGVRG